MNRLKAAHEKFKEIKKWIDYALTCARYVSDCISDWPILPESSNETSGDESDQQSSERTEEFKVFEIEENVNGNGHARDEQFQKPDIHEKQEHVRNDVTEEKNNISEEEQPETRETDSSEISKP